MEMDGRILVKRASFMQRLLLSIWRWQRVKAMTGCVIRPVRTSDAERRRVLQHNDGEAYMGNQVKLTDRRSLMRLLFPGLFLLGISYGAQAQDESSLSGLTIDGSIAVRFFFQPANADSSRPALIFRVARKNDSNSNSAPIDRQGRSAFVSLDEMKELLGLLQGTSIHWRVSREREEMLPFMKLLQPTKDMIVTVFATNGTASASIPSKSLCAILTKLDPAIKTPRASWEFALFRRMYHCKVPEFDVSAYPDHY